MLAGLVGGPGFNTQGFRRKKKEERKRRERKRKEEKEKKEKLYWPFVVSLFCSHGLGQTCQIVKLF